MVKLEAQKTAAIPKWPLKRSKAIVASGLNSAPIDRLKKHGFLRPLRATRRSMHSVIRFPFSGPVMLCFAHVFQRPVEDIFQLVEQASGHAFFHHISRCASVRDGEFSKTAEINKHNER
jgi:hypothetical protein